MPPAVWEAFVEEALTTNSIFPSSLTSRVRMSSSSTAIVLFRSAACKENNNKTKQKSVLEYSEQLNITDILMTYRNQP